MRSSAFALPLFLCLGWTRAVVDSATAAKRTPCSESTLSWGQPVQLPSNTRRIARFPIISANKGLVYMAGANVPNLLDSANATDLLSIWREGKGWVQGPAAVGVALLPQVAVPRTGAATLLWGGDSAGPRQKVSWPFAISQVWASSLDDRGQWSTPVLVFRGGVVWGKWANDAVAAGRTNIALAVPLFPVHPLGVLLIRFDGSRWTTAPVAGVTAGVTSTAVAGDSVYVAYLGVDTAADFDMNSVFLVRSSDGGTTWASPQLVSRSGKLPARDVRVRVDAAGRIYLMWVQRRPDSREVLRLVSSSDGGRSFSTPSDLVLPNGVNAPQMAVDPCGTVIAVYEHYPNMTLDGSLEYAVWRRTWLGPRRLFPSLRAMDATLAIDQDGRAILGMISQPALSPASTPFGSYFARLARHASP